MNNLRKKAKALWDRDRSKAFALRLLRVVVWVLKDRTIELQQLEDHLPQSAEIGFMDMIRFLVDNKVKLEVSDPKRNTPLIQAADSGSIETVKFLVRKGADVSIRNDKDQTVSDRIEKLIIYFSINQHREKRADYGEIISFLKEEHSKHTPTSSPMNDNTQSR